MGFTLQGINPSAKPPAARHHRITLLLFFPQVALPQVPRPGIHWACSTAPRTTGYCTIYQLQGLRPHRSRLLFGSPQIALRQTTCPSWAFFLLMVLTLASAQDFHPATVTLRKITLCCQSQKIPCSTAQRSAKAAHLSQDEPSIPRFPAFAPRCHPTALAGC